jgi:chemotaxis protein CheX
MEKNLCSDTGMSPAATNGNSGMPQGLDAARNAVAGMLADEKSSFKVEEKKQESTPLKESINPDCILYQLSVNTETDIQVVRMMRRKCAFRDIPILIVTPFSEMPRANVLVSHGANGIVLFPAKPEVLLKSVTQALEPVGTKMPVITKVINPYISATVDLLSTMAGLHAEKKEVFLKKNYRLFGDISAIMSLSGKVEGEVIVCFEEKLAREVVGRIMSMQPDALAKDVLKEGIGEVVNIVAGNAKAALANSEYTHQIGLPTVVFGQGHEIAHPGNAPCIVVIFEVNNQPLAVLVSMTVKL